MIGSSEAYYPDPFPTSAILPELRELLSRRSGLADFDPEELQLALRSYLPRRPEVYEVEAAMEALRVEGQVLA